MRTVLSMAMKALILQNYKSFQTYSQEYQEPAIHPKLYSLIYQLTNLPTVKKCGHVVKGHKRPRNQPVQCPSCPNQICCEAGKGLACSCQWHQPIPANQVQAEPILVSTEQNVTVLSFLESQATLFSTESSNACTAISLLAHCPICCNTFPEISRNNLKDIQDNYVSLIMKGNALYDIIEPPLQQPNLEIDEVLDKMEMPIKIGQGGFR